jgi:hypothetical protein
MEAFLQHFGAFVLGVLHGFDRLRFRGSKRQLCHLAGLRSWLGHTGILLKDYKLFARDLTLSLCAAIEGPAERQGLYRFLNNCRDSKEEVALRLAAQQGRTQGLIAVLGCVEPCQTIQVRGNPHTKRLELRVELTKCKHYYHYYLDPHFGLRYTRLQTWFPFTAHVGLNGRDWLARQMTAAGIAFTKEDNCFTWVEDFAAAQQLADAQGTTAWPSLLEGWLAQSNPLACSLLPCPVPYYWSLESAEYATDIAFGSAEDLARLYPLLVRQAITTLGGPDVLRFFGYRLRKDALPRQDLAGEVTTKVKELVQGTCVKHQAVGNLLKMYDKFGRVLRIETLLRDLRAFKVYRTREGQAAGPKEYLRMRQGVADMHGRAEVSRRVNERYAAALAGVEVGVPLGELTKALGQRVRFKGRSVRALNPLAEADVALLEAVSRGEFVISGFRNRDLRGILYGKAARASQSQRKQQSTRVTRLLRLLRGHGLIAKVAKSHRYQVTEGGRNSLTALLAARKATTKQLLQAG